MIFNKTILILEDNLHVVSLLLEKLWELEGDQPNELSVMLLTNSEQVERYINTNPQAEFDVILLDRDCKLNKSFHILDFERLGPEKIISISTVPEYNAEALSRGATRAVEKDLRDIDLFVENVVREVAEMIR